MSKVFLVIAHLTVVSLTKKDSCSYVLKHLSFYYNICFLSFLGINKTGNSFSFQDDVMIDIKVEDFYKKGI